jgi:hypothetical protein
MKDPLTLNTEYVIEQLRSHLGINQWYCEEEGLCREEVESMALGEMKKAIRLFERDDDMHCKTDALVRLSLLVQELCGYYSDAAERAYEIECL